MLQEIGVMLQNYEIESHINLILSLKPLLLKNRVSIFAPLKVDFGDIVLFK